MIPESAICQKSIFALRPNTSDVSARSMIGVTTCMSAVA